MISFFPLFLVFISHKFIDIGGKLLELKCRNHLSNFRQGGYVECLRSYQDSISEIMESFIRATSAHNDTFDGAAAFLFNLVLGLRVTGVATHNTSR